MPRGRRTSYTRDNNGRFASSPGGGAPKRSTPATRRAATRAGNRLNRDNAGRISGIGRNGATVRGGRLKTAKGNRRATQLASMRPAGFRSGTIAKGGRGVRGSVARSLAAVRKARMAAAKPEAAKQQPQRPSKKPTNKAQRAYLAARSNARDRNRDLRGADAGSRRMANSAAAVLRNMERRRSAAVPKAPADSPRARQQQRQLARSQRAGRNEQAAWAREADGPGSKASRSATVARRAQQIYAGKVDPKAKTKSRLTRTSNPEVLRKRIAKIKDNTARAAAKAAAKAAKAAAKPKPAKPAAAAKAKPPVARKGKTVEQVRKQWDERIAPSFNRRKSAIEKMPQGAERGNKMIALARRERNAGGALVRKLSELQSGTSKPKPAAKKAARGPKVKLPRMATPTGVIRGSDRAKVKADAQKGIGTPYSRASQRAIDRSAREAPLQRKQAIAAAKRKGRTGCGKGAQMNAGSIGNRDFAWNKNETPATARERLAMWRKSEQRRRGNARRGSIGVKGAAGALRASRRAAALVDSGNRLGNLPATRKMAEQPRQRRLDRVKQNETRGSLASYDADRRLLPQIQKVRDAAQKRIAEGKKPTAAQREKERKLVGEYNKATRQFLVAKAAKSYMQNPYGFKPQRMSGAVKAKPTAPKRTRSARPAGTVAKPRGMKPGVLAARRGVKAAKAPAIQATGRTRAQAAAAQRSRNKRLADYAEFSISLNPRVSRNSRVTEEGRYAESFGRPVIARRKYSQPNIFGGTDRVAGSNRARLVGTRERGQVGVIPLAARALPIKGRGKKKPRPYGSR